MNLSEQEVRAIVRDELRNMVGASNSPDIKYLPTEKAYKYLGYNKPNQLRELVANGTLRLGKEVQDRRNSDSHYSRYFFNMPACEKRLNLPSEKRGA
ncbi:MAG: hypothetical protein AAF652_19530 [Cyanobacteria bacterium P01_C01_bin.72]